jgi:hypothetical protein
MDCDDMFTSMEDDSDRDFISSITAEVIGCLNCSQFFEKLDDLLCPTEGLGSHPEECNRDYKLSQAILREAGFDTADLEDIFDVLRAQEDAATVRFFTMS